jgi:5-methylcytosine-specific restriction endonuclease McrA
MPRSVWGGRRVQMFTRLVLATYGRTCHLCGLPGATTADHLIPRSKGGAWWAIDNARPAHYSCNSARGDRTLDQWFTAHPLRTAPALTPSREW